MSKHKQCPTTVGVLDAEAPSPSRDQNQTTGRSYWRSLDDLAGTPEFREALHREFPAFASELTDPTRRNFLRVMGASIALAGAATLPGCRRPDHRIMTYSRQPEDIIPGKPLFYATAMPLPGGGAEGLLVETHEGRPTKLEGNPLHPVNQGRSSAWAQASVLDLYDPDRLQRPTTIGDEERIESTWDEFDQFAESHFAKFDQNQGAGLAFLIGKTTSPSRDRMRDIVLARWPKAQWLPYEAVDDEAARQAAQIAFGAPLNTQLNLAKAKVIVSIGRDFLSGEGSAQPDSRGFATGRRVSTTTGPDSEMSRVYAIESTMTLVGASADHRLRLKPSQMQGYVVALAKAVIQRVGGGFASGALAQAINARTDDAAIKDVDPEWIAAVADDLVEHRGAAVVTAGPTQPTAVHAMVHAINAALGAMGKTMFMQPMQGDTAASSVGSIRQLAQLINSGKLDTLVVLGANPVYDAPANLGLHEIWSKIPTTIALSVGDSETGVLSTWQLNAAHYLETWGDITAVDSTLSVVQPMIAPLFDGRSEIELLARLAGEDKTDGYEIVRQTWRTGAPGLADLDSADFDKRWNRALHNGLLEGTTKPGLSPSVNSAAIAKAIATMPAASTGSGFEVIFAADRTLYDGRWANNGWLQEFPEPASKVTWDNPAMISAKTAKDLGVVDGHVIELTIGKRTLQIPVFRQPGMADGTILLTFGGGRERVGRIGAGVGFNTYLLRTTDAMRVATGASVNVIKAKHELACVQDHWAMEGRALIREFDLQAWHEHGDEVIEERDHYNNEKILKFGERVGNMVHAPVNKSIYKKNQQHHFTSRPQWGMSIDLNTCSGCGTCTIACQAENNIPVVGRYEVLKGREMHWIRVDRYYTNSDPHQPDKFTNDYGDAGPYTGGRQKDDVDMVVQPVACVQCENAPCETVCPVNATVTGPEGTNNMAYNRCIGTRYCLDNCPYKVRRFNFFDFATKRLHGDYIGKKLLGKVVKNEQLIPPRLRERIDEGVGEIQTMQYNPNVTVRERGVMEKCTYCIQRINAARVDSQLQKLDNIPEGFFQVACQQACPTESIVFGDILDPLSKIRHLRDHARAYQMLGYLNVIPRTTYLARLRNTNPRLRDPIVNPFHHGGSEEAEHESASARPEGHIMSLPVLMGEGALA